MSGTVFCCDCSRPVPATVHGSCLFCGSDSVLRLQPRPLKWWGPLPATPDTYRKAGAM